jgi:hypothetical protein
MEIDPRTYPSRAFIWFTAENQLIADLTGQSFTASVQRSGGERYVQQVTPSNPAESTREAPEDRVLDKALFEEIARTTFHKNRYPELYQSCGTPEAAKAVEAKVAAELVETYRQIKQKQKCPIVERLNGLL